jgi:hypothetical protein
MRLAVTLERAIAFNDGRPRPDETTAESIARTAGGRRGDAGTVEEPPTDSPSRTTPRGSRSN